jgi:hypothetical protein
MFFRYDYFKNNHLTGIDVADELICLTKKFQVAIKSCKLKQIQIKSK